MNTSFKTIDAVLNAARHVYVFTHAKPDGDAIGSLCAMMGYLKMRGVSYTAYCADPISPAFKGLPWVEEIRTPEHTLWNTSAPTPDVVVLLDVYEIRRTGMEQILSHIPRTQYTAVVLDHHPTSNCDAEYSIIKPDAGSTTELLYDFFTNVAIPLSQPLAQTLLMGLITDTENFTNRATSEHTLDVAQSLIHSGGEVGKLTHWSLSKDFLDLKRIGHALSELMYNATYDVVSTVVQYDPTDSESGETKGLANFMKRISCGAFVMVITQTAQGIKVSLRSQHDSIDVRKIAQFCGGGGHTLAAGFEVPGTLQFNGHHWEIV